MTNTELSGGDAVLRVAVLEQKVAALEAEKARGFVSDALRQIAGWMDTGGPTYHEAEMIGMAVSGPTECSSHKKCTKAAKNAFIEAARIWDHMHPLAAPASAERVEPVAILCREIGETSWFDHNPLVPGSNTHITRSNSPEWDTCPVFSPAPAAPDVSRLVDPYAIAQEVRDALDRQACPNAWMIIAYEAAVDALAAHQQQEG